MNIASRIIARFGGARPAARVLGIPSRTVQSWSESGFIPAHRQQLVLDAGQALDPPLTPDDFFMEEHDATQEEERGRSAAAD